MPTLPSETRPVRVLIVCLLLSGCTAPHAADVSPVDTGATALHAAAAAGDVARIERLVNAGEPVNARNTAMGRSTPLHLAAFAGHAEAARALLGRGALPDARAEDTSVWPGMTPVMLAASQGHAEALAVLLEAGARALGRDATGRTALHWAAVNAHADAVGVLLDAGADPRVVDRDGYAPLHLAVTADADPLRVVRTLLRAGADPNQLAHGLLPLTLAERRGHTAAADALRDVTR